MKLTYRLCLVWLACLVFQIRMYCPHIFHCCEIYSYCHHCSGESLPKPSLAWLCSRNWHPGTGCLCPRTAPAATTTVWTTGATKPWRHLHNTNKYFVSLRRVHWVQERKRCLRKAVQWKSALQKTRECKRGSVVCLRRGWALSSRTHATPLALTHICQLYMCIIIEQPSHRQDTYLLVTPLIIYLKVFYTGARKL